MGIDVHHSHPSADPTSVGHATLTSQLEALGLSRRVAPHSPQWDALLDQIAATYGRLMETTAPATTVESLMGTELLKHRSSYTNLFECAPVPILEHDYHLVADWMNALRDSSVTDLDALFDREPDTLRDAIALIRITAVNPEAAALFGESPSTLVGPVGELFVDDGTADAWRAQLRMSWNGDTRMQAEFTGTRRDGTRYEGVVSMSAPTPFDIPDYSRVVVSINDISAHKSEERRMRALVDAKNHFLASVSHEIRTPLTGVIGFAELLKEDAFASDPEERRDLVSAIARQAADVANIVEDLLVAARAELGELEVVAVPVNLSAQIAQVLETAGSAFAHVETPSRQVEPRIAIADPGRVRQIVRNLLTNANRYGGPHVSVKIKRRASTLFLSVIDDGGGLPEADWERIFASYEGAHPMSGRSDSVGIGLTISRELARLMGGELTYRFADDQSIFELSLPAMVD